MTAPLLDVRTCTSNSTRTAAPCAVRGVGFTVESGETLAIVRESIAAIGVGAEHRRADPDAAGAYHPRRPAARRRHSARQTAQQRGHHGDESA
jgi:hypothetical protein